MHYPNLFLNLISQMKPLISRVRSSALCVVLTLAPLTLQAADFFLGADISWCTEMEKRGLKVYNYVGEEREATALMKEMGLNAIRLRVWVDPKEHGGWCDKNDLLVKALRAKALGMEVMVDFHYSDWWADPGKQNMPAAWAGHKYKEVLQDVANHTRDVLQLLKDNGVTPRWVQVGNETSAGMLWPMGKISDGRWRDDSGKWTKEAQQYAGFFKAGYAAVKEVFPTAQVIVHLDNGYDNLLYNNNLDALRENGARWDVIGMSLYPFWTFKGGYHGSVEQLMGQCINNMNMLVKKYGTDVMIAETGYKVDDSAPELMEEGRRQLASLIRLCREYTSGRCQGVFYWEPTCRPKQYELGAFSGEGKPTSIMRAFTMANLKDVTTKDTSNGTFLLRSATQASHGAERYMVNGTCPYDRPLVTMHTEKGDIIIELYNETPKHRDNFLKLVKDGALNGKPFYRVVKNFVAQFGIEGDPETLDAEITYPVHLHWRGVLAAARRGDEVNPTYRSSATNFYFVWGRNEWDSMPSLDKTYTVFGEVVGGMDVLEAIMLQPDGAPAVRIESLTPALP